MSVGVCIKCGEVLECELCNPQSQNSLKLLKAEIAEIVDQLESPMSLRLKSNSELYNELRQLSAVQ